MLLLLLFLFLPPLTAMLMGPFFSHGLRWGVHMFGGFDLANFVVVGLGGVHVWCCACFLILLALGLIMGGWCVWFEQKFVAFTLHTLWWLGRVVFMHGVVSVLP